MVFLWNDSKERNIFARLVRSLFRKGFLFETRNPKKKYAPINNQTETKNRIGEKSIDLELREDLKVWTLKLTLWMDKIVLLV